MNLVRAIVTNIGLALLSWVSILFAFAAGNILGGFHGAEWCYFNGQRAARSVVKYLANLPK